MPQLAGQRSRASWRVPLLQAKSYRYLVVSQIANAYCLVHTMDEAHRKTASVSSESKPPSKKQQSAARKETMLKETGQR